MCLFSKHSEKQSIEGVNDSNINMAGGDINNIVTYEGVQYPELRQIVTDIVRSEMFQLSRQANVSINNLAIRYEQRLIEKLADINQRVNLEQFAQPGIQIVLRDSLKQYVKSASEDDLNEQIDMLIDRLHTEENVMKSIIEESIITLPKLSKPSVALLAAMHLRDLMVQGNTLIVISSFANHQRIYSYLKDIRDIDIAYLRQLSCCYIFSGLKAYVKLENLILDAYNFMFRHCGKIGDLENIVKSNPFLSYENGNKCALFKYKEIELMPSFPNKNFLNNELKRVNEEDKIAPLSDYFSKCTPFTEDEVRNFVVDIAPNYKYAFETLNRGDVVSMKITPLGAYIGQKFIIKQLGVNCPDIYESFKLDE